MRRLASAILAAAALSGCATTPHRSPDVRLPDRYETSDPAVVLAPADLDRWWLLFKDAQLNALEDEAFAKSPDARTVAARIAEARATRASQIAQTLPTGKLSGKINRQVSTNIGAPSQSLIPIGGTTDTLNGSFDVSWELDLFGRLAVARKGANASLAQQRFNIEGSRASLAANVADTYFQAKGLAVQLDDARENLRIQGELAAVAQKKADLGLGLLSDADRIAGSLAQSQAQVDDLEAQTHAAERQLLILIGRGIAPTASLGLTADLDEPPSVPGVVPGDLLARRPDVREAEAKVRVQAANSRLKHLAIFPTFTLLPGLGASHTVAPGVSFIPPATLAPDKQTTDLGFWYFGVGGSMPLLDIPRLLYDAKAEDARTEEAVIAYEKTVQTAYGEAENDLVSLGAGERSVATLRDGEVRAKRAADAAKKRYGMGLDDVTAALTAEQSWRDTKSALTTTQVQALRRAVQTYKALGGGWAYASLSSKTP